ncbi:MAG: hypothetical protein ACQERC_12395 [Bacteroidota bacterium]
MGKIIILSTVLFIGIQHSYSQHVKRDGLLKVYLTLAPGIMLDQSSQPFYFHGNLEGYVSEQLSIAGDGFFYLGDLNEQSLFRYNNSIFAGLNWHPAKEGPSDPYIGFQPGIAFTKLASSASEVKNGVNPLVSLNLGYNYFINNYFHFFVAGKLIVGEHAVDRRESLNALQFSAGLGFSLPTKKPIKRNL